MTGSNARIPVIVLLGPAGVGKTTLAEALARDAAAMHVDLSEIAAAQHGLEAQFREFAAGRPETLVEELTRRAVAGGLRRAVVVLPSHALFSVEEMRAAGRSGVTMIVLFASRFECLNAFLERERATGRNLGAGAWERFNEPAYRRYRRGEYAPLRLEAFRLGERRPVEELVDEVLKREMR